MDNNERFAKERAVFVAESIRKRLASFPQVGEKLIFSGVPEFYYPMFTNLGENAEKLLTLGETYIIRKCEVYSSWCEVWLEGIDGEEVSDGFNLTFFKRHE